MVSASCRKEKEKTLKLINGPKKSVRLILLEFFLKVKWLNFRTRGGSIIAHMTEIYGPEFISDSSPANGKHVYPFVGCHLEWHIIVGCWLLRGGRGTQELHKTLKLAFSNLKGLSHEIEVDVLLVRMVRTLFGLVELFVASWFSSSPFPEALYKGCPFVFIQQRSCKCVRCCWQPSGKYLLEVQKVLAIGDPLGCQTILVML